MTCFLFSNKRGLSEIARSLRLSTMYVSTHHDTPCPARSRVSQGCLFHYPDSCQIRVQDSLTRAFPIATDVSCGTTDIVCQHLHCAPDGPCRNVVTESTQTASLTLDSLGARAARCEQIPQASHLIFRTLSVPQC